MNNNFENQILDLLFLDQWEHDDKVDALCETMAKMRKEHTLYLLNEGNFEKFLGKHGLEVKSLTNTDIRKMREASGLNLSAH